jgi:uncharacterized membrane protein
MIQLSYSDAAAVEGSDRLPLEIRMIPGVVERLAAIRWLLGLFAGICVTLGLIFYAVGAGPVLGFMGLEVLLLAAAYQFCRCNSRTREFVVLTGKDLFVRKIDRWGSESILRFQPQWLNVDLAGKLTLSSKGRAVEVGSFLTPGERRRAFDALQDGLQRLRLAQLENDSR